MVQLEHAPEAPQDGGFTAIGDCGDCAITDVPQNGVEGRKTLHKKEIGTQRHVAIMFQNGGGDDFGDERGRSRGRPRPCGLSLDHSDVRALDDEGALGIRRGDWAVTNQVPLQNVLELRLDWPPNLAIQVTGNVGRFEFAPGKLFCVATVEIMV